MAVSALTALSFGLSGLAFPAAQPASAAPVTTSFTDLGAASADGPMRLYDDGSIAYSNGFYSNGVFTPAPTPPGAKGPMSVDVATGSGLLVGYADFDSGNNSTRMTYWRPRTGEVGAYASPCSDVYPQKDGTTVTFPEYYVYPRAGGDNDEVVTSTVTCYPDIAPANTYVTLGRPTATGVPLTGVSNDLNASIDAVNDHWILQSPGGQADDTAPENRSNRSGGSSTLPIQSGVGLGNLAPDGTALGQDVNDDNVGDVVAPDGTVTRLAAPPGRLGGGVEINAAHVIAGDTAVADSSNANGFSDLRMALWSSPTAQPVDLRSLLPAGWTNAIPFLLNNRNEIVGGAKAPDGRAHVFLLGVTLHTLSGSVTDGLGTPIAGATVTALGANGTGGGTAVSGADGSYRMMLPATGYSVSATDAKADGYQAGTTGVDLTAGDASDSLQLVQQLLSGHAYATSCGATCSRAGLPGVSIDVRGQSVAGTPVNITVATGADGSWSQHVPRGTFTVTPTLSNRGFDPENSPLTVTADVSSLDYSTCADTDPPGSEDAEFRPHFDAPKLCPYKLDWTMPNHLTVAETDTWAKRYGGLPEPSSIYPTWKADIFLTQGGKPLASCGPDTVWTWTLSSSVRPANSKAATLVDANGCKVELQTPTLGTYEVRGSLSKTSDPKHNEIAHVTGRIVVRDLLIAAVGDSNGSGEGDPPFFNRQCNRSLDSYQFLDARRVEGADPRTSVTMIFVSCSGATVENLTDRKYAGINPQAGGMLLPQLEQVAEAIDEPVAPGGSAHGRTKRTIDAILTSIGVNNLSFGSVLGYCGEHSLLTDGAMRSALSALQCQNNHIDPIRGADGSTEFKSVLGSTAGRPTLDRYVRGSIERLTGQFAAYKRNVVSQLKVSPSVVVMTTYPDFTTDDSGAVCGSAKDILTHPFPPFVRGEWKWLQVMGNLLNHAVDASSVDHFRPVDGIAPKFIKHGYCARHTYIRSFTQQKYFQHNPDGPFHPSDVGHTISANANFPVLCKVLFNNTTCKSQTP